MFEDLPDVPPAISLIASEMAPDDDFDSLRKRIVSMLPDLRSQSEQFLDVQIGRESDLEPGSRFEAHLHGAIDPLSRDGCFSVRCRIAAADRVSRSVGLIADRVWLTDLLSEHIVRCQDEDPQQIDELVKEFIVVRRLLPLIAAGVIRFRSPRFYGCKNCFDEFNRQVDKISHSVAEAFASEFSLGVEPDGRPYIETGNAVLPTMVATFNGAVSGKVPSLDAFRQEWVREQVDSVLMVSREASFTHGTVVSNSRIALAGLLQAEGRMIDHGSMTLLEDERNFTVPWVSRLSAAQIVELRGEAADALPRFREKLASAMALSALDENRRSRGIELITELREQAEEVRSELAIAQKRAMRYWKTTYGLLDLGLSAFGVITDHVFAGVGGLLSLMNLHINHEGGETKDTLRQKSRPGYVLLKAQDILAHSDDH